MNKNLFGAAKDSTLHNPNPLPPKLAEDFSVDNSSVNLYDRDFCLWTESTAQLLRERKITEIDLENLAAEVEDMGKIDKRAIASNLRIVLMHLLKCRYQPEKLTDSWINTIIEHRLRIEAALEDSPSLKRHLIESFDKSYQLARKQAAKETKLVIATFPISSPFTHEQTLDEDFFADGDA